MKGINISVQQKSRSIQHKHNNCVSMYRRTNKWWWLKMNVPLNDSTTAIANRNRYHELEIMANDWCEFMMMIWAIILCKYKCPLYLFMDAVFTYSNKFILMHCKTMQNQNCLRQQQHHGWMCLCRCVGALVYLSVNMNPLNEMFNFALILFIFSFSFLFVCLFCHCIYYAFLHIIATHFPMTFHSTFCPISITENNTEPSTINIFPQILTFYRCCWNVSIWSLSLLWWVFS